MHGERGTDRRARHLVDTVREPVELYRMERGRPRLTFSNTDVDCSSVNGKRRQVASQLLVGARALPEFALEFNVVVFGQQPLKPKLTELFLCLREVAIAHRQRRRRRRDAVVELGLGGGGGGSTSSVNS